MNCLKESKFENIKDYNCNLCTGVNQDSKPEVIAERRVADILNEFHGVSVSRLVEVLFSYKQMERRPQTSKSSQFPILEDELDQKLKRMVLGDKHIDTIAKVLIFESGHEAMRRHDQQRDGVL